MQNAIPQIAEPELRWRLLEWNDAKDTLIIKFLSQTLRQNGRPERKFRVFHERNFWFMTFIDNTTHGERFFSIHRSAHLNVKWKLLQYISNFQKTWNILHGRMPHPFSKMSQHIMLKFFHSHVINYLSTGIHFFASNTRYRPLFGSMSQAPYNPSSIYSSPHTSVVQSA